MPAQLAQELDMSKKKLPEAVVDHPEIRQWFAFKADGRVTMQSGKVEIGQGINTAFIQIAADELDVNPQSIDLVSGDTRSSPDEGVTAGSRSMQTGGVAVRYAASAARHALLREAAKLLQANADNLSVKDGQIFVHGRQSDLTYWSLATSVDLSQNIADFTAPKKPEERTLSGTSLARIDLPGKILGKHIFVHDLEFDDMLHARVVNPPRPSARIEKIDEAALRNLDNVFDIARDGTFLAILAENEFDAERATKLAHRHITWSHSKERQIDPIARIKEANAEIEHEVENGNVTQADGKIFSTTITRPYLSHGSIGPSCAIAKWCAGHLTIHCHSQGPFTLKHSLCGVFKLDESAIDVVHVQGSGCYGHNGADDVALDAALAAKAAPNRPVRVQWSRADEFSRSPLAPAMISHAEAKVRSDGMISSFEMEIKSPPHSSRPGGKKANNLLAASHLSEPIPVPPAIESPLSIGGSADRNSVPTYAIHNTKSAKRIIRNMPWRTSAMRGLGAVVNIFAIETLMDDIAHELNKDPLDYRLAHAQDPRIVNVLKSVAEMAGWPNTANDGSAFGIAYSRYKNISAYCAIITRIELDEDIRVTHAWAACDAGEAVNPDGIINQIEGGMVQSTSWTLKEAVSFDGEAISSTNWESYPIIKFAEVPLTEVRIIDHPTLPPLGVGEAAQGPMAAAIGNAVFEASGVRIRDLPITRDKLVAALA